MSNNSDAIAVFDSGIGGLSVLKELSHTLPNENFIYFGDGVNCPYGEKSAGEVERFTFEAIEKLISYGAKIVVVACNTASSVAIKKLRDKYPIPFVAMEPAVKPAALTTKSGIIGVLATRRTIEGKTFKALCSRWSTLAQIECRAGSGLVEIVESGNYRTSQNLAIINEHITTLIDSGVDKIVLGCTHYPFLMREILEVIDGRDIEIFNPAPFIAQRVKSMLDIYNEPNDSKERGVIKFLSNDNQHYAPFIEKRYKMVVESV